MPTLPIPLLHQVLIITVSSGELHRPTHNYAAWFAFTVSVSLSYYISSTIISSTSKLTLTVLIEVLTTRTKITKFSKLMTDQSPIQIIRTYVFFTVTKNL